MQPIIYDHVTEEQFRGFDDLRAKLVELQMAQNEYASRGRELLKNAKDKARVLLPDVFEQSAL